MIWYLVAILAGGLLLLLMVYRPRKLNPRDLSLILHKWKEIEALMIERNFKEAIMEADKLVDFVFRRLNIRGNSFGERLKSAKTMLDYKKYDGLWQAHKLRNQLVHEIDFRLSITQAEIAIDRFYQALRNLKAL